MYSIQIVSQILILSHLWTHFVRLQRWKEKRLRNVWSFSFLLFCSRVNSKQFFCNKLQGNPAIFIEANFHAREWVSSATATWIINELITSTDPEVRAMANTVDWYIVPVANPDGFVFSHTTVSFLYAIRKRNCLFYELKALVTVIWWRIKDYI